MNSKGKNAQDLLSQYAIGIEEKLDLERLKEAQNFQVIDIDKMDRLAKAANIEESIEELFDMLD
jgi:hypothetical protein